MREQYNYSMGMQWQNHFSPARKRRTNPNALKDGARRLHGRPVWKYLPNNRLRAIGCENRYYFTTERECWIAYSVQLEAQSRILKERQLKVTESIDTALAQIISIQDREMGK